MKRYKLSICIPTYNNTVKLYSDLVDIFTYVGDEIQVVVLDNNSEFEEFKLIYNINDPRLKIVRNDRNLGLLNSMVNIFNHADGEFAIYKTDKDNINVFLLDDFLKSLRKEISCGMCDNTNYFVENKYFKMGAESLKNIGFQCKHPTGYFVNVVAFKRLDCVARYLDYGLVNLFPLDFVFADLSFLGDSMIYGKELFRLENKESLNHTKSNSTNFIEAKPFFHPTVRALLLNNFHSCLLDYPLSYLDYLRIYSEILKREFINVTLGYRRILNDNAMAFHYSIPENEIINNNSFKNLFLIYYNSIFKIKETRGYRLYFIFFIHIFVMLEVVKILFRKIFLHKLL